MREVYGQFVYVGYEEEEEEMKIAMTKAKP